MDNNEKRASAPDETRAGTDKVTRPCFNEPSFWQCIDALCPACDSKAENVRPVAQYSSVFGGWHHSWIKGNGHMPCGAAKLWDLLPETEKQARTFGIERKAVRGPEAAAPSEAVRAGYEKLREGITKISQQSYFCDASAVFDGVSGDFKAGYEKACADVKSRCESWLARAEKALKEEKTK